MRTLVIVAATLVVILVAWLGVVIAASESGEVVILHTRGPGGETHATRLWVVDHRGHAWLRAGDPDSGWFERLQAREEVRVERGGRSATYTAVPVRAPEVVRAVNERFAAKYGMADRLVALGGREESVPVRLEPRAPER